MVKLIVSNKVQVANLYLSQSNEEREIGISLDLKPLHLHQE